MQQAELVELFRKLGAQDPAGWASSQLQEGIPQLARFLFLRQAWRLIVDETDSSWIEAQIARAQAHPAEPYSGVGHALRKLRALGAANDQITDLVRGMQAELLFSLCYLLEDPGSVEPEVADLAWSLFRVNEDGHPIEPITSLHESVLETDPTGREMRPRSSHG